MTRSRTTQKLYFAINRGSTIENRPGTLDGNLAGRRWRYAIPSPVEQRCAVVCLQPLDALGKAGGRNAQSFRRALETSMLCNRKGTLVLAQVQHRLDP
jgi:hypothetical protein